VTTQEHEAERSRKEEKGMIHGTVVLKLLVGLCAGSDKSVAADSYFASVQAAILLKQLWLRFIGDIKTATRGFPMKALQARELCARGDSVTCLWERGNGNPELMALLWLDRERRYFKTSSSSAIEGEQSYSRVRWRQTPNGAQPLTFSIPQLQAAEVYYTSCRQIDRHNRCRQDDLMLDRKYVTHDWSMRVNMSLLGM
jgi:hypothetical protein